MKHYAFAHIERTICFIDSLGMVSVFIFVSNFLFEFRVYCRTCYNIHVYNWFNETAIVIKVKDQILKIKKAKIENRNTFDVFSWKCLITLKMAFAIFVILWSHKRIKITILDFSPLTELKTWDNSRQRNYEMISCLINIVSNENIK